MKLSTIFGGFWGINDLFYLIFEDPFEEPIFPNLIFLGFFLSQDTKRSKNMNKLDLNILDAFFL